MKMMIISKGVKQQLLTDCLHQLEPIMCYLHVPLFVSLAGCSLFAVFDSRLLTLLLCFFVLSSWTGTPCSWVCQRQAMTSPQLIRFVCVSVCLKCFPNTGRPD